MLSTRIALRYLFSKKSHRAVNIIAAISIAGVAVATMATVVVLSVFNGFSKLSAQQLSKIDPELKITAASGKTISNADSLTSVIMTNDGVKAAEAVIEERAMLVSHDSRIPVEFKAVSKNYRQIVNLDSILIDGVYLNSLDSVGCMQLSIGVANRTGLRPGVDTSADLYVPRRQGRINPANPATAFRSTHLIVSGVIEVERAEIDNDRIIIPLQTARQLLDYDKEATAIEISLNDGRNATEVAKALSGTLGTDYTILDREQLQSDAFRMISIEKWITFMMLLFILAIASFNIISTLSLLVVEKRHDMTILRSLGASRKSVRDIFISLGFLITIIGGTIGIALGIILSLIQEYFGIIRLAGDPEALAISVYPVAVEMSDIAIVFVAITVIGIICSQITRLFTKNIR